jgi:hypothetical protein
VPVVTLASTRFSSNCMPLLLPTCAAIHKVRANTDSPVVSWCPHIQINAKLKVVPGPRIALHQFDLSRVISYEAEAKDVHRTRPAAEA